MVPELSVAVVGPWLTKLKLPPLLVYASSVENVSVVMLRVLDAIPSEWTIPPVVYALLFVTCTLVIVIPTVVSKLITSLLPYLIFKE